MMKSIPVPSAEVQSLSQIHEAVARAHAVLSGDFGKEIETMKALREELIERQGTIDTVDKARALSIQADAHALEVKADAAKVRGDAKEANDKAVAKLATVVAREEAVGARERAALDRSDELDRQAAQARSVADIRAKELTKREEIIAAKEADIAKRLAALKEKEKTVHALMQSLAA